METALIVICVCLLVLFFGLMYKYVSVKRNIRRFSNEHTDIQRQLGAGYEESKKQLSTVISGISHDFRTPLTAALGYMQMIEKSGELSEKNAEYLGIAMQKNRYLKELSDEFFELTKIENTARELDIREVRLSNILTETVLEQHSWIAERGISTDFDIAEGIVVKTDMHCLTRVLENLMSNAQKYTDDSFGVTLSRRGEKVYLRVSNTLSDSTSLDIGKVFEPFYRMDARTSAGSGLGLYVVSVICGRLGWSVEAHMEGRSFSVELMI